MRFSWYFLVLNRSATCSATRIHHFITSNHASFNLWWKKNLLNHQKVSKYHEHDCLQNFLLLFMYLLTALIVKNSHILAGIYVIFLRKRPRPSLKSFQYIEKISIPNLGLSEGVGEVVIEWGKVGGGGCFPGAGIFRGVFETGPGFRVGWCAAGGSVSVLQGIFTSTDKIFFREGDWQWS